MEKRTLGKTGHESTVLTFGAYAIGPISQDEADRTIEYALAHGINHFDIAPSYADAELRLGDYLKRHPLPDVFISCKTQERSRAGAEMELKRTLDRLGRDKFDLYQFHAVCTMADLEDVFALDGSAEAVLAARKEGLVGNIGITGHGMEGPAVHLAATERFDFATVMTACNPFLYSIPQFRDDWDALMAQCSARHIGVQVLKAGALGPWGDRTPTHQTWYAPLVDQEAVNRSVAWVLQTQPVTTLASSGDPAIFEKMVIAAEAYAVTKAMSVDEILQLTPEYGNIFATT